MLLRDPTRKCLRLHMAGKHWKCKGVACRSLHGVICSAVRGREAWSLTGDPLGTKVLGNTLDCITRRIRMCDIIFFSGGKRFGRLKEDQERTLSEMNDVSCGKIGGGGGGGGIVGGWSTGRR